MGGIVRGSFHLASSSNKYATQMHFAFKLTIDTPKAKNVTHDFVKFLNCKPLPNGGVTVFVSLS